jgi:PKD domain
VTINNAPPVANAGADQTLTATGPTTPVTLNGSASSDPDGEALTFAWTQGTTAVGNSAVLPLSLKIGTYAFTLTVTDAGGLTSTATTHVTINNAVPLANAGADQTLAAAGPNGAAVTLNGSLSRDPDGDALTFLWTQGTAVVGTSAVVPLTLNVGTYTFTLTVTDAGGLSSSAVTHVTVTPQPPSAVVSPDPTVQCAGPGGTLVTLDGSGSTGSGLTYVWTEGSTTVGRGAKIQVMASLGTHPYMLTVSNSAGSSSAPTTIQVVDTIAPNLSVFLSTGAQRLHNNRMVLVNAKINVSDVCDASPKVKLLSITSNDPADRGRYVPADVQAVGGGSVRFGSDVRSFELRAERPQHRTALVYTVTYSATDASGNTKTTTALLNLSGALSSKN